MISDLACCLLYILLFK